MSTIKYNHDRYRDAIKIWIPLSAAGALISFIIAFIMHVPLRQMIFAIIFTADWFLADTYSDRLAETKRNIKVKKWFSICYNGYHLSFYWYACN